MKIFSARHGETQWNKQNKICGRTDILLTQKGKEQAEKLAKEVQKHDIDIIISSPLKRAQQTSEIVSKVCGASIITDYRLIEQDYGIYEGADRKDFSFLESKKHFAYKYPNGESMMQVAQRVYELLDEIKGNYSDKNVLLISHGGVCRIINTYFKDMTNDEFYNYTLNNAELEEYCF